VSIEAIRAAREMSRAVITQAYSKRGLDGRIGGAHIHYGMIANRAFKKYVNDDEVR
jgi:hypothetical protein